MHQDNIQVVQHYYGEPPHLHSFPTRRSSDLSGDSGKLGVASHRSSYGSICRSSLRAAASFRSEEHTSELQSRGQLVCRLLREKKNKQKQLQFICIEIRLQQ